jgi:hypothetical protein
LTNLVNIPWIKLILHWNHLWFYPHSQRWLIFLLCKREIFDSLENLIFLLFVFFDFDCYIKQHSECCWMKRRHKQMNAQLNTSNKHNKLLFVSSNMKVRNDFLYTISSWSWSWCWCWCWWFDFDRLNDNHPSKNRIEQTHRICG